MLALQRAVVRLNWVNTCQALRVVIGRSERPTGMACWNFAMTGLWLGVVKRLASYVGPCGLRPPTLNFAPAHNLIFLRGVGGGNTSFTGSTHSLPLPFLCSPPLPGFAPPSADPLVAPVRSERAKPVWVPRHCVMSQSCCTSCFRDILL